MLNVSIIILSYNTKDLLQACLASLYKHLPAEKFEIIVVDNASTDDSVEMVKKHFKEVMLIKSEKNLGFGKGINLGVKVAKGKYFLFLNSDVVIKDDVISPMISFLEDHEKVGIAGGLLVNADGTPQRSYGLFYSVLTTGLMLIGGDRIERLLNGKLKKKSVDWVSGGFMMVRREVFEKLHGFDEQFFMYMEDMEICYRTKSFGYDIYLLPEVKAVHAGQGSSNRGFAVLNIYKGLLYFFHKHKSSFEYQQVKSLLKIKAVILISVGMLTRNAYLQRTYKQALTISI